MLKPSLLLPVTSHSRMTPFSVLVDSEKAGVVISTISAAAAHLIFIVAFFWVVVLFDLQCRSLPDRRMHPKAMSCSPPIGVCALIQPTPGLAAAEHAAERA